MHKKQKGLSGVRQAFSVYIICFANGHKGIVSPPDVENEMCHHQLLLRKLCVMIFVIIVLQV
ncbi:hypothetical protein EV194_10158 [Natronoflexus pectinivorans]|uniref:Uncharacterized protein n=1 Tax=Natronoflexus pectinivorans TaxID=682526 RepID=A0A4R2GN56_9BACT|nr:hypothetical protein EV194_10158 [Natronoflexus pectinivorans]